MHIKVSLVIIFFLSTKHAQTLKLQQVMGPGTLSTIPCKLINRISINNNPRISKYSNNQLDCQLLLEDYQLLSKQLRTSTLLRRSGNNRDHHPSLSPGYSNSKQHLP